MATRKNPADLPIEEKLKNLYNLQQLLSEIDRIKTLRGELPLEVQDLEDEIEGLNTRLDNIQNSIEKLQEEVTERRRVISENQQKVARYNEQLDNVRNNREYDLLNKEIEYHTLDIELNEKKIREGEQLIETRKSEMLSCAELANDRRAQLDLKKSELDEIISETKADEEKLHEKADNIEATIETRLLTAFKRIRKNSRNGLGIVYVERDACGGCFNKIPPQRQLDIRMRKKIIVCEYCGRIMIDPDLAGVKTAAKKVEEKKKRTVRRKRTEEPTQE